MAPHLPILLCSIVAAAALVIVVAGSTDNDLLIVTVATEKTDGLKRLQRSAEVFGHSLHVIGLGEEWSGGDMQGGTGGAQKIRLLREKLPTLGASDDSLIMFIDAYDVIINGDKHTIIQRFHNEFSRARVLFAAEPFCWPDKTLVPKYPVVTFGERYLNSGMFIGYYSTIMKMLNKGSELKDNEDDQLFYTQLYLDVAVRADLGMELDHLSMIFQNLNGLAEYVALEAGEEDGNYLAHNKLYNTHPVVIHGNGPSKVHLLGLGNYLAHTYNSETGWKGNEKEEEVEVEEQPLPKVGLAIFITKAIPYVEEFLYAFSHLDYPKSSIDLFIHNNQDYNKEMVAKFVEAASNDYHSIQISVDVEGGEHSARTKSIEWAAAMDVEYLLILDADVHLAEGALRQLIHTASAHQLDILSPMVVQPKKLFSNFWGAVSDSGYYRRSDDYIEIVERQKRGVWNVPFINSAVLISKAKLPLLTQAFHHNPRSDADMSFAEFCRTKGHFMFVDNRGEYGFLVMSDDFAALPKEHINRELYDYPNNHHLWEARYIHPGYFPLMKPDVEVPLACPDVYDFPIVSERFAAELIQIMEHFGQWSDGGNVDRRLEGGYENVPTRDIHMNQVNFDKQWLGIMDEYVAPMQEKVFIGYYQRPVKSSMMFVVRYRLDEQNSLRPHHDASTYSIDIALNKRDVDYEGGGVRYIRYNCTVPADQVGWTMLFPGRLTHMHEGLPTTKGTRYILVSFINP